MNSLNLLKLLEIYNQIKIRLKAIIVDENKYRAVAKQARKGLKKQ